MPNGNNKIGISIPKARAHTIPPKNKEPVSPIKTFAGLKFHTKKPMQPPATQTDSKLIPTVLMTVPISIKNNATKNVTDVFKPSMPSVKLTAFTIPTITIAAKIQ